MRIGASGYKYDHWKGLFYPESLPKTRWFEHYSRLFDTVEINASFYRLPRPATFEKWRRAAPAGFCFAVKYSRFGTHLKHLKDPETHVPRFLESAERLDERLGPVLVQLPPRWAPDLPRLRAFLETLPRQHRWALEIRDPRWLTDELYDLLRSFNVALVQHDMIPRHPEVVTADFVYVRYHGNRYAGSYDVAFLRAEADRLLEHREEVFAYFNNDVGGHAVFNALDLKGFTRAGATSGRRRSLRARPRS